MYALFANTAVDHTSSLRGNMLVGSMRMSVRTSVHLYEGTFSLMLDCSMQTFVCMWSDHITTRREHVGLFNANVCANVCSSLRRNILIDVGLFNANVCFYVERGSDHITPRKEHVGRFNAHVQHAQDKWRAAQAIVMVASANDVGCERPANVPCSTRNANIR